MFLNPFLLLLEFAGIAIALRTGVQPGAVDEPLNANIQAKCGKGGPQRKIYGGVTLTQEEMIREAPWMVSINYEPENKADMQTMLCSGVLISPRHVLTAAHCQNLNKLETQCRNDTLIHQTVFRNRYVSRYRIRTGSNCGHKNCNGGQFQLVKRIIYPYSFTDGQGPSVVLCKSYNDDIEDIAIYELTEDVPGAEFPCIAKEVDTDYNPNVTLTNYGYGYNYDAPEESHVLKKQTLQFGFCPYVPKETPNGLSCAKYIGDKPSTGCAGDSGSPYLTRINDRLSIVGLLSRGVDCSAAETGNLYILSGDLLTTVPLYTNWICKWTGVCIEGADPTKDERPTRATENIV